jgi:ABC-2 type transport system ATP-binding protein
LIGQPAFSFDTETTAIQIEGGKSMQSRSIEAANEAVETGEPIIWSRGLSKKFNGTYGVSDIHFEMPRGAIYGFIGPSGCGKTTTVRLLTGIYKPSAGEARVLGRAPTAFSRSDREKIGYMPQHFVLYPDLTVWENISFVTSAYGVGRGRSARIKQLLEFVELDEHKHKLARQISGGMLRRLSLATTLVHRPELVFLDEPTASIDPILRRKFWDYFQELKNNGTSLFITTQYVGEAVYCDKVGVLLDGRLLVLDTPEGLRRAALGGDTVILKIRAPIDYMSVALIDQLPFVKHADRTEEEEIHITVHQASTAMPDLVDWCAANDVEVDSIREYQPPFDDVFVTLIEKYSHHD